VNTEIHRLNNINFWLSVTHITNRMTNFGEVSTNSIFPNKKFISDEDCTLPDESNHWQLRLQ
jgi:hypothetical protein